MTAEEWIGRPIADRQGEPYGTLEELFVGRTTGEPEYGIVSVAQPTGQGSKRVAVPLAGGRVERDVVVLPLDPGRVRAAPEVQRVVESIPPAAGERINAFFAPSGEPTTAMPATHTEPSVPSAPAGQAPGVEAVVDEDVVDVTVSEEELVVDKRSEVTERVRLHKRIVEEEVTVTVTLRREELVIERIPIDRPDVPPERGNGDEQLTEGVLEFVLLAEEPVIEKRIVPVERIKVARDTIVEQRRITDEVRKERAEVETDPVAREEHHPV